MVHGRDNFWKYLTERDVTLW